MKTTLLNTKPFCRKTVVAIGKFDGVHIGHAKLLETAAKTAQCLNISAVAYITDNPAVQKLMPEDERRTIFRNLGTDAVCTDELTDEYKRMTPAEFVHKILGALGACHVVVGYNFRFGCRRSGDVHTLQKLCAERGIGVTVVDCVYADINGEKIAVSSTEIRSMLSRGETEKAACLLGRRYSLRGTVCCGKRLGRTIGFPTANLVFDDGTVPLANGVYATDVYLIGDGGATKLLGKGITNVGHNPTVDSPDGKIRVETCILGYDGDLYGKKIKLEFKAFMRGEVRFSSIDELKSQLEHDKKSGELY